VSKQQKGKSRLTALIAFCCLQLKYITYKLLMENPQKSTNFDQFSEFAKKLFSVSKSEIQPEQSKQPKQKTTKA
jgi:hypothetical protein